MSIFNDGPAPGYIRPALLSRLEELWHFVGLHLVQYRSRGVPVLVGTCAQEPYEAETEEAKVSQFGLIRKGPSLFSVSRFLINVQRKP